MNSANSIWRERYHQNSKRTGFITSAQFFSRKESVDKMVNDIVSGTMGRAKEQLASLPFSEGDTVLDIGAGPGTLAVPLAKRGCAVTVIEPSTLMIEAMGEYCKRAGVDAEIGVIPDIIDNLSSDKIGTYDYVVSSFAMAFPELKELLMKMNAAAKKQVHIFWFINTPSWGKVEEDLWHVIHPGERIVRSHADLIWNCLYEEGIYANLTVHDMNSPTYYENAEDAVSEYVRRLCAETDEQKDIVRWYIVSRILKTPNGYMLPDDGKYAHIWWDTV